MNKFICVTFTFTFIFMTNLIDVISYGPMCGVDRQESHALMILDDEEYNNNNNNTKIRNLQSSYETIRIHFDYFGLDSQSDITEDLKSSIKIVLAESQKVIHNLLKVKRLTSNIKFSECNSNITISNEVKKVGVSADLVIFPFVDVERNDSIIARSSACQLSGKSKRPAAGYIIFSLKKIDFNKTNWKEFYTLVTLHEMSHILVFSPELFKYFVDPITNLNVSIEKIMKSKIINGEKRNIICSPKVVETAKRYFKCDNLEGVELENQGGNGTVSSHWEARIMLGDYMIGFIYDEIAISEITLALFEDSGWYQVNYFTGGLFRFGKNAGCKFLNSSCICNNQVIDSENYCNIVNLPKCLSSRTSKGNCGIRHYSIIENSYQYFSNSSSSGGISYIDYCPVAEVNQRIDYFFHGSCIIGKSNLDAMWGENISQTSGCFMSSLIDKKYNYNPLTAISICYKYECDFDLKKIIVNVGEKYLKCPSEGGEIELEGFKGKILCPYFSLLCSSYLRCNNLINCAINSTTNLWDEETFLNHKKSNYFFIENNLGSNSNMYNSVPVNLPAYIEPLSNKTEEDKSISSMTTKLLLNDDSNTLNSSSITFSKNYSSNFFSPPHSSDEFNLKYKINLCLIFIWLNFYI